MPIDKETLIKLPLWQKALALVGFMVVVTVVWYLVFYDPTTEEMASLRSQIEKLQKQIQEQQKAKEARRSLEAEIKALEQELKVLSAKLPEEKEIPELLSKINELGRLSGLEFMLFKQGKPVRKDYYSEIPVEVQVQGGFHSVMQFLSKVASMDRIVHVSNVKMGQYKPIGGGIIVVSFIATTYKYESEPPPKKEPPKKKPAPAPAPASKGGKVSVD